MCVCVCLCVCAFVCVCMCKGVYISKTRIHPKGRDIFHNTCVSSVFLALTFHLFVWSMTALQAWSVLVSPSATGPTPKCLGGKRIRAALVTSGPSFHGLAPVPRTVAQCLWGRLGNTPQSQGPILRSRRPKRPLPLHGQVAIVFIVIVISTKY